MRILLIFLLNLSLISCQDKKTKVNTNEGIENIVKSVQNDSTQELTKADFLLTEKNIMNFLLDYGKKNKENTVRLTTDYGTIDILLFENIKFHRANFIMLTKKKYFDNTQVRHTMHVID